MNTQVPEQLSTPRGTVTLKHIDTLRAGDIVLCRDGMARTLTRPYIKSDNFMGRSIWGDSYKGGHELVPTIGPPWHPSNH